MQQHSPDNALYAWLLPFITQLRGRGLPVTPDTHIKLVKVLDAVGNKVHDPKTLLDYIIPLLAQNTLHVSIIKEEFDRFLELNRLGEGPSATISSVAANTRRKGLRWLIGSIVVLLIGLIVYLILPDKHPPIIARYQTNTNPQSLDVTFSAMPEKYLADTQQLIYHWDFGDGVKEQGGVIVRHAYKLSGNYQTSLTLGQKGNELAIRDSFATQKLTVCKPQILIDPNIPTQADSGMEMMFTLIFQPGFPPESENVWLVNGTEVARNTDTFYYTFSQTGMQLVQYTEAGSSVTGGCQTTADKPVYIKAPREIDITVQQAGKLFTAPWKRNIITVLLLALLVAAGVVGFFILRKIAAGRRPDHHDDGARLTQELKGEGEPFEIPFVRHDELIDDEPDLYKLAKKYNHRIDDNEYYLNVQKTISATILADGFIQPMYSSRTVPAEYLVLIDRRKPENLQTRLFQYLVKKLAGNDVHIEQFHFTENPGICFNEIYPDGISIMRLHDLHPRHSLILFSEGYCLLDPYYPSPDEMLVAQLKRWKKRVIFTPVSYHSWDHRERALSEALLLLPADIKGQIEFFELEEDGVVDYEEDISGLGGVADIRSIDFQTIAGIRQYLNDEVFLLQWLCALAIYPQLQWDIMVAIGDALQRRNYRSQDVSYTALLKMVRIPWMQDKFFPPGIRLELLKLLEPVNEKIARETLIGVLNEAGTKLTKQSFAWEELFVQQTTDKAILFAHDPEHDQFKHYEGDFYTLKKLWQSDLMSDQSLVTYLSKPSADGDWTTLVGNDILSKDPAKSISITPIRTNYPYSANSCCVTGC